MKKYSFVNGPLPADGLDFVGFHTSFSEEQSMEVFLPKEVIIPLLQHRGAPSECLVKKGDYVQIGQPVGRAAPPLGAQIHASISGEVTSIEQIFLPDGRPTKAVRIESDAKRRYAPFVNQESPERTYTPGEIFRLLFSCGIVGMGGEGYPAHYRYQYARKCKVKTLFISGLQCEPYMICDSHHLRENGKKVVKGALTLAEAIGAKKVVICIQDKWVREITSMYTVLEEREPKKNDRQVRIAIFRSRYPQGYEKLIAEAYFGVPADLKRSVEEQFQATVCNVSTCVAIADMIEKNLPCVSRVITLAGEMIGKKNILTPIGTKLSEILSPISGIKDARIVFGGMLTGVPVENPDMPVLKTTSGIMVLQDRSEEEMPCIRCGSCEIACPVGMIPYLCEQAALHDKKDMAQRMHIDRCISCGACSYVCPSRHPLSLRISRYKNEKPGKIRRELKHE